MSNAEFTALSELLSPAAMILNLKSRDRDGVLAELVAQIPDLTGEPAARETLLRALHEREQLHSTGIGDGVALPHARNALVGLVDHCVLVFGRHPEGIPYGAIDGAPARLFFLLVAPSVREHLAMLARISRLMRVPKLRQSLLNAENAEKVRTLIKEGEARLAK
jgi:mannitol/fructose-specific phosphotransferase system IIA component (Ntr-type)